MKPHKHAEIIKAWADGAEIQWKHDGCTDWQDTIKPDWNPDANYRIKPEPKPDVVLYADVGKCVEHTCKNQWFAETTSAYSSKPTEYNPANLKLTFDGETGELKSAEVLK